MTLTVDHVDRNTVSNANIKFLESITMVTFGSETVAAATLSVNMLTIRDAVATLNDNLLTVMLAVATLSVNVLTIKVVAVATLSHCKQLDAGSV